MDLKREDFIIQYPPVNFMNRAEVTNMWPKEPLHLYIHIPFCVRKCGFCYYRSETVGNRGVSEEYLAALKKEIQLYAAKPEIQSKTVRSVYIGGGTPTLLNEQQIDSLLSLVLKSFNFASDFEFCSEARPGPETTLSKIQLLKSLGLNRLSLGCQSLDEEVLKVNYCNHGVQEFYRVFEQARQTGVRTINADLLSGMVNQSLDSFMRTIEGMIALRPDNIAIYKMEVYLNSALYKKLRQGSIELISDETEIQYIRDGYLRIRDAGYAQVDHFSFVTDLRHDHVQRRGQWNGEEMLGVGASAYSRMNSFLFQNESRVEDYIAKVNQGEPAVVRAHQISQQEKMIQRMVLGLKNLKVNRIHFFKDFGVDVMTVFPDPLNRLAQEGFITLNPDMIESTFEGAIFADDIAREFYLPEHKAMMLGHAKRSERAVAGEQSGT